MVDDWMTDEHKAAALEGFRANPVAVAYAKQQTTGARTTGHAMAGYNSAGSTRIWFGEANGCTATLSTKAPEHGGPDMVFVRPILTATMRGVELVDIDGVQLVHNVVAQEGAPTAPEPDTGLVTWLREQIAETVRIAQAAKTSVDAWAPGLPPWESARYLGKFASYFDTFVARQNPDAVLAQCDAHTAILDAVQRGLDGHPGPCVNVLGDDPANYSQYDSCALHIEWSETALKPFAARLVALAYRHNPGYREEWRP
jgi:hypothetical protein